MKTHAAWQEILAGPARGQHIAQTYREQKFLVEAVALFIGTGLKNAEGVLIAATRPHLKAFADRLESLGYDVAGARQRGQLVELPADEVLSAVMVEGLPEPSRFKELASAAIRKTSSASRVPGIRIYGELVNVCWLAGNMKGAMAIESLWDELSKIYPFTLFCGYHMDGFDKATCAGPLQSVCRSHSHVIPAEDYEQLDEAVTRSSRDVLGDSLATVVRGLATTGTLPSAEMPAAQKTLIWLRENMPVTAEKVVSRSRAYYEDSVVASGEPAV